MDIPNEPNEIFPSDYLLSLYEADSFNCGYCGENCGATCSDWEDSPLEMDPVSGDFIIPEDN